MGRTVIALLVVCSFALPVAAQEADCSEWHLKGLRPGMTFEGAAKTRTFNELVKYRDKVGYRRYAWTSEDKLEKIDLHVDMQGEPPSISQTGFPASLPRISQNAGSIHQLRQPR